MLWAGLEAYFFGRVGVDVAQLLGVIQQRAKIHVWVLVAGGPNNALRARETREPDGGMGFLDGQHPRIYSAIVVVFPFIPKRAGLCPALDDQIMGFFEPLPLSAGIIPPTRLSTAVPRTNPEIILPPE